MRRAKQKQRSELPIGHVPRPEGVHLEAFGLVIRGDCLSPRARDGQVAIVEPMLPEPGEMAAFWFKGRSQPVVKILHTPLQYGFPAHPESEVFLAIEAEQLNPPKRYFTAADKLERVCRVHSIVEMPA